MASRTAAALARQVGDPLLLVHAVEGPSWGAAHADALRWRSSGGSDSLAGEADRLREGGVSVETQSPVGRADEVLVRLAAEGSARLIVVASLGRRGKDRWFLGSVSERTAERATAPTLVVRDAAPFEAWARGERPLRVFVAFNFTPTSEAALRWVGELRAIRPVDVVIGYVDWPPETRSRGDGTGRIPLVGNAPEVQAELERDLTARATGLLGGTPFRARVEANWGRPDLRLAEMAREEKVDLILVGSHQYRGFERLWHASVSRGLLHGAAMSVLVVPLPGRESRPNP